MATLTNTKIKDTYDGLLKTADNDVIGASEKNITDGLGNATVLSIGTDSASFSNNVSITGSLTASNTVTAGTVSVNDAIVHTGDTDTKIEFLSNQIKTTLGGTLEINSTITGTIFYKDIEVNGLTIGLGSGDIVTNTALGAGALLANTSGSGNVSVGQGSLQTNTTGSTSVAVGKDALRNSTTAIDNVAVGYLSLFSNTTGGQNAAFGALSLYNNTTGGSNTALGYNALSANIIGSSNVAVGRSALISSTGSFNTAVGTYSLNNNTTANSNIAIGYRSLYSTTTGGLNIAVGNFALDFNTTGLYNTALGHSALYSNETGGSNTALGYRALYANTYSNNTAIGSGALESNTTGGVNTAIGKDALNANTVGGGNTAIGYQTLQVQTSTVHNTAVGHLALKNNIASYNTAVGSYSLDANTTGTNNTSVGYNSLSANTSGNYNVAIGSQSLDANTTGVGNTALGHNSLSANTTGINNTAVGANALQLNVDGIYNVALGHGAGSNKTGGSSNTYIGYNAIGGSTTSSNEIVIGKSVTGKGDDTAIIGGDDIYLGNGTLGKVSIERGANTLLEIVETSHSETLKIQSNYIGGQAIYGTTTLDHVFYIGASEKMRIGSSTVDITGDLTSGGNVDIAGDLTSGGNVHIVGDLTVGGTMPSSDLDLTGTTYGEGDILTVSSSGTLTKIDKDTAAEYLGVNSVSLMRDLSFGESYINNFRSRVIDNTGTYFPTPAGYSFGVYKNKGYVNKMGVALLPSGVKSGGLFSVKPSNGNGDFDFTRASTATYVDEDGLIAVAPSGTPRLDYPIIDGVVQDTPSLLLEPQRTNLFSYSNDFSDSSWAKSNLSVSESNGAWEVTDNTTSGSHYIFWGGTVPASTLVTLSVEAKAGSEDYLAMRLGGFTYAFFDLRNGTLGSVAQQFDNATITPVGNGYYKCTATITTPSSGNAAVFYPVDNGSQVSYTGTNSVAITIRYAQLEAGSYPTSYIPTSGSAVTRAAEECNGAGTSADFNDSEGVLFAEISALVNDGTQRWISIGSGSASNRVSLLYPVSGTEKIGCHIRASSSTVYGVEATINDTTTSTKAAIKYKNSDISFWVNGFEVDSNTSATISFNAPLSELAFDSADGGSDFYGKTKQLITFKEALTDAELEELTSWQSFNDMAEAQEYKTY